MSRTFDADHILAALIEEYQAEGHFIFNDEGTIFARMTAADFEEGPIPFEGKIDIPSQVKIDVCLTSLAAKIAQRLSR